VTRLLDALTRAEDLLRLGDYARGWPAWEAVRDELSIMFPAQIPAGYTDVPMLPHDVPVPLHGMRVVVLQEGGAGDTFMTARYAKALADDGARVYWQSPPEMAALLRTVPGMHTVLDRPVNVGAQCWVRALSLPARYGAAGGADVPYIRVPLRDRISGRLHRRPRVGLRLRSGALPPGGEDRNVPPLAVAELTHRLRDFYPVDLDLPTGTSWSDTARLIASCDAVISVDTGVAHLAGAMGARLEMLLPHRADWRWGQTGSTASPWYPTAGLWWNEFDGWMSAVKGAADSTIQELLS